MRTWIRGAVTVLLLLSIGLLGGCASATRLYPGAKRPAAQVATLKMVTNGAIIKINGRALEGRHYELLPGTYDVDFRYILRLGELAQSYENTSERETLVCKTQLTLNAGRDYEISRKRGLRATRMVPTKEQRGRTRADTSYIYGKMPPTFLNETNDQGEVVETHLIDCSVLVNDHYYEG